MPVTLWSDIPKGSKCEMENCTNYATHYYGSNLICCDCHMGANEGLISNLDAAREYHENPNYLEGHSQINISGTKFNRIYSKGKSSESRNIENNSNFPNRILPW